MVLPPTAFAAKIANSTWSWLPFPSVTVSFQAATNEPALVIQGKLQRRAGHGAVRGVHLLRDLAGGTL